MDPQAINDQYWVAAQIQPNDIATLSEMGFTTVICNRPDDEDAGQPSAASIAAACESAGLEFHHVPVTTMPIAADDIKRHNDAIAASSGKVLAYCRSGHRCTLIFAARA